MSLNCRYLIVSAQNLTSKKYWYCKRITRQTPFELSAKITWINSLQNRWYPQHRCKINLPQKPVISNKCFIHSPAKEKAKTSIIEFWPYQLIRWLYLGAGLLIKRWCAKPRCWHEMCYMGKVSTFFFIIISKANVAYFFQKIKKKFIYSEKNIKKMTN